MNNEIGDRQRPEVDMQEVLRAKFTGGEGVVCLSANMTDAALLLAIKHAAAFGAPFMVIPPAIPADDSIFEGVRSLELHAQFRATGMLGPFTDKS